MTDKPDFDPIEEALQRCKWCIIMPDDGNVIGPFNSSEEAEIWSRSYRGAAVRLMNSPEFEILCRAEARSEDPVQLLVRGLSPYEDDSLRKSRRDGEETETRRRRSAPFRQPNPMQTGGARQVRDQVLRGKRKKDRAPDLQR